MLKWPLGVILRSSLKPLIYTSFLRSCSRSSYLLNHYETLKLSPSASLKEIKDAYFKLTKQFHPDLHPNDPKCHERFIELQEAYKILSNPVSRGDYDAKLRNRPSPKYQRPYAYPDFTQRDEWIKQEQMRRENHFRQEFGCPRTTDEFNRFYSRPHRLTPDELERFYKYKKFVKNDSFLYYLFGGVLAIVVIEILVTSRETGRHDWDSFVRVHKVESPRYYSHQEEGQMIQRQAMKDDFYKLMKDRQALYEAQQAVPTPMDGDMSNFTRKAYPSKAINNTTNLEKEVEF